MFGKFHIFRDKLLGELRGGNCTSSWLFHFSDDLIVCDACLLMFCFVGPNPMLELCCHLFKVGLSLFVLLPSLCLEFYARTRSLENHYLNDRTICDTSQN